MADAEALAARVAELEAELAAQKLREAVAAEVAAQMPPRSGGGSSHSVFSKLVRSTAHHQLSGKQVAFQFTQASSPSDTRKLEDRDQHR